MELFRSDERTGMVALGHEPFFVRQKKADKQDNYEFVISTRESAFGINVRRGPIKFCVIPLAD
jgi:hypothetical protein